MKRCNRNDRRGNAVLLTVRGAEGGRDAKKRLNLSKL
jgi:hypothetical protein